jgi:hypothetical protein
MSEPQEAMMTTKPRKAAPPKSGTQQVTSAAAWRSSAEKGHVVPLPSGNTARLRRTLDLPELLKKGVIPNPLAPLIQKMLATKAATIDPASENAEEAMLQMVELVNGQIPKIFLEPRVEICPDDWDYGKNGQWEPSEGAIALEDLDFEDRMFAFAFSQGGPDDVATFRNKREAALATLEDGSGVQREAERLGGVG